MPSSDWVHLDVEKILKETDRAILCQLADGERVWIPLSQVSDPDDYSEGDENCTVSVTEQFAHARGLT